MAAPGVIEMVDNLAVVDYDRKHDTRDRSERCPTGAIVWIDPVRRWIEGAQKKVRKRRKVPLKRTRDMTFLTSKKESPIGGFDDTYSPAERQGIPKTVQVSRRAYRDGRQHRRRSCANASPPTAPAPTRSRPRPRWASTGRLNARRARLNISGRPLIFYRTRGRARGGRGDGRHCHDRPAGRELLLRPGHRLHARVALRGRGQAADLRAEHRRAGDDQGTT